MEFRTIVDIPQSSWQIGPCERMLFVGSCFADNIGKRFVEEKFCALVNPYGVMYNPASILHTVERLMNDGSMPFKEDEQGTAVFTLGTNHVYILNETGEIVDNCRKRPQSLFTEKCLSVDECSDYLLRVISLIQNKYPLVRFILTVSPIRYRKYGYHGSQLSKATLLLSVDRLISGDAVSYFPSYEIMNDELRDYRFYKPDMLHPTDQAVDYMFERLSECYFSDDAKAFIKEWKPVKEALAHRPFHPESEEYKAFMQRTREKLDALKAKYPGLS